MSQLPDTYPITGLCVVADPEKCPPGYELLYRSHDRRDDCDLWKDSFFKARVTRYLCYTRVFPLDGGRLNNVLVDIAIQNNGEYPPSGFTLIEKTIDSGERSTRKKQVCVKLVPRNSTIDAISELVILSKSKRPPSGYTMIGEVNGLIFCFKTNPVPADTQSSLPQSGSSPSLVQQTSIEQPTQAAPSYLQQTSKSYFATLSRGKHMYSHCVEDSHVPNDIQESIINAPLAGVPFQLSVLLTSLSSVDQTSIPEISYRSIVDLNNEYNYPFRLERQATN